MRNNILFEIVALTIIMASTGGSAALAQHSGHGVPAPASPGAPIVHTGKVKGTIVEVGPTSLTVETRQKGRTERIVYLINSRTRIKGDLDVGSDVVVNYRDDDGANVATSIQVRKAKRGC